MRGVVFLVDGLVANDRPDRGLDDLDVQSILGIKPHGSGHDNRRGARDRNKADLEVFLLQRPAFGERLGRGLQREELRQRGSRGRSSHRFQECPARRILRKHRAHHRGRNDTLVALLLALDRSLDLRLGSGVLGFADMSTTTATAGAKSAVGIEGVVEGGHQLLPVGVVSTPPKSAIAVPLLVNIDIMSQVVRRPRPQTRKLPRHWLFLKSGWRHFFGVGQRMYTKPSKAAWAAAILGSPSRQTF